MRLGHRLILAVRCLHHERMRSRIAGKCSGTSRLRAEQSRAWPTRQRFRSDWEHERFIVFDTETTGLDPATDQAISLGAVALESGRIVMGDTFDNVMSADKRLSRDSVIVHGITPDRMAKGGVPGDVLGSFLCWAGDAVLVAHHAGFDISMLDRAAKNLLFAPIQNLVLDTASIAARLEQDDGMGYDLDSLLSRYDIPLAGARHSALGDAMLTARLFQKLLKKLTARGVSTLADLAGPGLRTHRL